VGAVYWRIHKPSAIHNGVSLNNISGVLEVLFLAVREDNRNKQYGGNLVEKLKEEARKNDCKIIYVEIGRETPQAKSFWSKYGLQWIHSFKLNLQQYTFMEYNCLRFNDTTQYIWIDDNK